jgi:hypothetical protein
MRIDMRQMLCVIITLVLLSAAGLGMRTVLQPPLTHMIAPGATQIEMLQPHMSARIIIYRAAGPAYAWRATVERNLTTHGWARPIWWREDLPATNTYLHVTSFWFGSIWDAVELDGEPSIARISVRRWIELRWRWSRWLQDMLQNTAT